MKFLRRKRGSISQIGKPFPLPEKKKLPKLVVPGKINPASDVRNIIIRVNPDKLLFREENPVDLEKRAQYFIRMHMDGRPIPPILVYKIPGNKYKVYDGHARVAAYRILGIKSIPAILKKDNKGLTYQESQQLKM